MFNQLIEWVRRLFGRNVGNRVQRGMSESEKYKKAYEENEDVFTGVFSQSLANKAVTDCNMTITDANDTDSRRSDFIRGTMKPVWNDIKRTTSQALGKGGKVLVPYVSGNRIFVDVLDQTRVPIEEYNGAGEIVAATVRAETVEIGDKTYERLVHYELRNGVITINTKAINSSGNEVSLATVPEWAGIPEEITIGNVDRILFGVLKCPRDSRKEQYIYGVPITYGCDDTIRQLQECVVDIEREYNKKRVKVFADEGLFGKGNKLPDDGLFKVFRAGGELGGRPFYEVYDPAIRDSSYYVRFTSLCAQLEKEVGTSKGILTEPATLGATATEIKSANHDTFCLVSDIRKNIAKCLEDVAYSVDVLAERFNLTPAGNSGDYKITFDWDNSLVESSSETFAQLSELESRGLISGARLNSWVTGQTIDDAQAEIDAIEERKAKTAGELISPDDFEP